MRKSVSKFGLSLAGIEASKMLDGFSCLFFSQNSVSQSDFWAVFGDYFLSQKIKQQLLNFEKSNQKRQMYHFVFSRLKTRQMYRKSWTIDTNESIITKQLVHKYKNLRPFAAIG